MTFADILVRPTGKGFSGKDRANVIAVPADKSISHRIAMFAGLGRGAVEVANYPLGDDNRRTLDFVRTLGADIDILEKCDDRLRVNIVGIGGQPKLRADLVDCGNSGTTSRICMGITAGLPIRLSFDGDASLTKRPMRRVTEHLEAMGAKIMPYKAGGDPDKLPLTVAGGKLHDYSFHNKKASAQVKSAVLMAGLTGGVTVTVTEPALSRDHTERFLAGYGYDIETAPGRITLRSKGLDHDNSGAFTIPGDPSSAAFWAALAVLTDGEAAIVRQVCTNPTRDGFFAALREFGADIRVAAEHATTPELVQDLHIGGKLARGGRIKGELVVRAIDELPLLALLGMFVPAGEHIDIRDAAELRVKETDRIDAIADVIRAFGGDVETGPDWIRSGPPVGGFVGREAKNFSPLQIDACHDHRIAMGAAVAAIGAGIPILIKGGGVADISYPQFWHELQSRGLAQVEKI